MKRNVLVFPAAPYPAVQICDCLKFNMLFHPIAGSSYSNHSDFVYDTVINDLPYVTAENFITELAERIKEYNISFVIPTDDTAAVVLTQHQNDIPAKVVCSPYETALMCRHKKKTYSNLLGAPYLPKVYDVNDIDNIQQFPVFIKPDEGQGSRGASKIEALNELKKISDLEKFVICEFLPGEEYTVDCFTDRHKKVIFANPRSRSRLMNGITARGYNVPYTEEFKNIIDDINNRIEFRGYWFAQLKRDSAGNLKLMELCCRFAGTFGISKSLGVNLPLLALCDAEEMDANVIVNNYDVISDKTYFDRYHLEIEYDTVYIDYDDTITCENGTRVNPYIIAFLYQCKNLNRKLVLLTRHTYDHYNTLIEDMHRLSIPEDLFDIIHDIEWNDEKSNYISEPNSIFIDNSFAERKKIADRYHIPVFDVCNVDCLFDWR